MLVKGHHVDTRLSLISIDRSVFAINNESVLNHVINGAGIYSSSNSTNINIIQYNEHRSTTIQDFVGGMSGCAFDITTQLCIDKGIYIKYDGNVKHTTTHATDEIL